MPFDPFSLIGLLPGLANMIFSGQQASQQQAQSQQAAANADAYQQQVNQYLGGLGDRANRQFDMLEQAAGGFGQPGVARDILNRAYTGGDQLALNNENAARRLGDLGAPGVGRLATYDPDQFRRTGRRAQREALAFGDRARATAREQQGLAFSQQNDALNAMLASRGISSNSGVAAGALGQLAGQQGQQFAELNRGLADQAAQLGLQAGQFDAQQALGFAGLGVQNAANQNAAQAMRFQNQLAGQQFQAGLIGQQNALQNAAVTDPLQMLQGIYQQNHLAPQLAALGMLNPNALSGVVAGGQQGNLDRYERMIGAAGEGYGNAAGGALGGFGDFINSLLGILPGIGGPQEGVMNSQVQPRLGGATTSPVFRGSPRILP